MPQRSSGRAARGKKGEVASPLGPKNAEDNYEISDKGENSDEEDEPDRSQKHVPKWCESYLDQLAEQMSWDPDSIFGSTVPPCDQAVVFPTELYTRLKKQRPQRQRGSSQDWRRDRLRSKDVKEYKRKMGQTKVISGAAKTPLGACNAAVV